MDQACCAHTKVELLYNDYPDGSRSDYWKCKDCETRFYPEHIDHIDPAFPVSTIDGFTVHGLSKLELATIHANISWDAAHERLALSKGDEPFPLLSVEEISAYRAKMMVIQAKALIAELAKEK